MSLVTLFKFNRNLFVNLKFSKCNIHSMLQIYKDNSETNIGRNIKVQGWIHAVRKMKNNIFIDITDGSTPKMLQIVIPKSNKPDNLSFGSSIIAEGKLVLSPNGRIELHTNNVTIIGTCDVMDGYPFAPRKHYDMDYIRQFLHLRSRTRRFSSLLRLRDMTTASIENYLRSKNFINVHTPILTSNDCEGAGELFLVKPHCENLLKSMKKENMSEEESYFNTKAFLTVSGQLHLETIARSLTKVYTFGPSFRAENSKSRLHLTEFYMLEAELAFINNIDDIMIEIESLIKYVIKDVFEKGAADIHVIGGCEVAWLNKKFICITYDEAINILENNANSLSTPIKFGTNLSKEHELFLVKYNDNIPIFIINWPKESKPFYMKECKDDASKVAAIDLLVPTVGELVGGSLREDNYEKLKLKLPPASDLSWYLELRKYGNVPTGGFGMGFERFLQHIFNIPNIKDTLPFPRWPHNCNL
ncbi:probable asparagine--tRNA ligase, mitochondrial isoform X1 [Apis mellifera]|uniref:asparagine--tRNA ligase n=2 Tax=Apis mellifera TaxID=7460 RepID=A0A7M7H1N9_APIME|nr:probable asparagine--tRNA ligase, mitochondrial isoform X1 [Apis mellifera]|eukprot:XP_006569056.2 probable asparagine--tRNA ligase, mitochondrial isoform X1 [Apis mellifera]